MLRLLSFTVFMLVLVLSGLGLVSGSAAQPPAEPDADGFQLLSNPGMEWYDPPYAQYLGADCQVASDWERFWYEYDAPCWMDTRVFAYNLGSGWVERIEGATSQMILSTEPYTAGLQQQVSGLTPGVGYGFHAAMLTIFQSSAPPAVDGTMIKDVGMDPTGGSDPQAPTVVWGEPDDHDEGPWSIDLRTAVFAESPTMTVFIRVLSPYESGGWPHVNLSFLDSAILARTPVVTATAPLASEVPTFSVSWENAVAAPGGYVRWYDVQWLDEAEGVWHDWFERASEVQAQFDGEMGHAYRFRARAWQRYDNGAHLYGPYRPEGDARTLLPGLRLQGHVASADGLPLGGATVTLMPSGLAATSGPDGRYDLIEQAQTDPQTVTVSHPRHLSPAPVHDITFGLAETKTIDWILRPYDDAVTNGGFESALTGWSVQGDYGLTPEIVSDPVHTGQSALALGGTFPVSFAASATQTVVLTDTWAPGLSLWYQPEVPGGGGALDVVLTVVTHTISTTLPITPTAGAARWLTDPVTITVPVTTTLVYTPALDVEGWQQRWYPVGLPDRALTGTVTIHFRLWHDSSTGAVTSIVYLDEVSLGRSAGGPHKVYLPLSLRSY